MAEIIGKTTNPDGTETILYAPQTVLSQDLIGQFTPADMIAINAAISADTTGQMALLWFSMIAQRDPMVVDNPRFQSGWAALVQVLGADRMAAIAAALNMSL